MTADVNNAAFQKNTDKDMLNGRSFLENISAGRRSEICPFEDGTVPEFVRWRENAVCRLEEFLHLSTYEKCDPAPVSVKTEKGIETWKKIKFDRELIYINTMPSLSMPVYILRPENKNGKAAIALHGHGIDGKNGLVGIENGETARNDKKYRTTFALELAEKGYTVYCPDILGSGERKPMTPDKTLSSDCAALNHSLMAMGLNLQGVIVTELKRLIDYIAQTEENGADDLLCVGFSGGGLQALWLSALDERVKTAYISGYFHSLKNTLLQSNMCGCNFAPGLWNMVDTDTLAMLIAPRKLYIETGKSDKLNGINGVDGVYPLVERVRNVYTDIFGKDNFKFAVCEGEHRWYGAFMKML